MPALFGVAVVVGACLFWALSEFGSLRYAWAYASGINLIVEDTNLIVPEGHEGEVHNAAFLVRNLSSKPIQVIGVDSSCGCVTPEKPPMTIPARGIKEIRLSLAYDRPGQNGLIEQKLTYHTDDSTSPRFDIKVTSHFVEQ